MKNIENYLINKELRRKLKFTRAEFVYLFLAQKDANVKELLKEQIASNYLSKKYVEPYFRCNKIGGVGEYIDIVQIAWIYWAQGLENAPEIVKVCVRSAVKAFRDAGWDVKILDKKSVRTYADLPDYIWDKYEDGIIGDAHLSDLIRLSLLIKWGGCWCDATVFFSGQLPDYVFAHELFVFRGDLRNNTYTNISNWMIYSIRSHPILSAVKDILLDYWKKEKILIQYFTFHLVFRLVTEHYSDYWRSLPVYSNVLPHLLQQKLLETYSDSLYKEICDITSIHKLYWRIPEKLEEDSFYNRILWGK